MLRELHILQDIWQPACYSSRFNEVTWSELQTMQRLNHVNAVCVLFWMEHIKSEHVEVMRTQTDVVIIVDGSNETRQRIFMISLCFRHVIQCFSWCVNINRTFNQGCVRQKRNQIFRGIFFHSAPDSWSSRIFFLNQTVKQARICLCLEHWERRVFMKGVAAL